MKYDALTPEQQAEHDAASINAEAIRQAQIQAQAVRDLKLQDIPANDDSIIALKNKVNDILSILRGE